MGSVLSRLGLPPRFLGPPPVPGPDVDGQAIHEVAWGRPYPFETITLNSHTFHFYKRDDPLATFFLDDMMNLESRILIREEYRLAYDYFDRLQAEQTNKSPNFILTGQPGIGKTTFILYALLRRLEHRLPTVIQFTEEYFVLFDENGARKYPSSLYYHRVIPSGSWALVNSGYRLMAPGPALFGKDIVLVQTTSPVPRRWKEWKKQHSAHLYVMQIWDTEEIEILLAQLKKAENLSERYVEDGLSLARKYGPSIRMIVQILDGGQDIEYGYRQTLSSEAQDLVRTNRYIFNTLESSGLAEAPSSAVIFLRPSSLIKRYAYEFFVPTAEIARQLSVAALTVSSQDQQRFFSQMSSYPSTRSAAGWIFENFMHTRLTERDGHVRALDANYKEHDIPIVTSIITGSVEDLKSAPASFYWRPGESTFPGIDAVARDQNDIWAFQCTVSRRQRSTIDGLERVAQAIGIRESNWHLVIVGSEMPVAQSARAKQARLLEATKRWSSVKTFACELTLRSEAERLITLMSSEEPGLDGFKDT